MWKELSFVPLQFCNTYGLHYIQGGRGSGVFCTTIGGEVVWVDDPSHPVKLNGLFNEEIGPNEVLELIAADSARHTEDDCIGILATCWIVNDEMYLPQRYFGALFKIKKDFSFVLGWKDSLKTKPTFTRVTEVTPLAQNRRCILIFTNACCVNLFTIEQKSAKVCATEIVGDIFPGLDLQDLSGATIRTSCLHTKKYRWSGLGSETGTVIITALLKAKNDIVCRAKLKFEGVISVLQVLKAFDEEDKVLFLISSMIGPPTIWTIATREEDTEIIRTSELLGCVGHDAVICSGFSKNIIAIGTYGGRLIFFRRKDILEEEEKIYPCFSVDHTAPILALRFLSDEDLVILSRSGVHTVKFKAEDYDKDVPYETTVVPDDKEKKATSESSCGKKHSLRRQENQMIFR
uniref:PHTB1_N domain-containing protein n=1 Tax=Syphacia muris TaxID=451379 RepID=A0A0N5AE72_9BILA